jgi:hypothetical protein
MGKACSACNTDELNQQEVVIKNTNYRDEKLVQAQAPIPLQEPTY